MKTQVRAFPRLHFCLLDLGFATSRLYGGAGCLIEDFAFEICAESGSRSTLRFERDVENRTLEDCHNLISRLEVTMGVRNCSLIVHGGPPEHIGLGSKTALLLGMTVAACRSCHVKVSRETVIRLTQRGGASGVGVNAFFTGGFIADDGHDESGIEALAPSSIQRPHDFPIASVQLQMPNEWRVRLALGPGQITAGAPEQEFFATATPIPRTEVLASIAHVYHGLVPAIHRCLFERFRESLASIQKTGFKKREIDRQGSALLQAIGNLTEGGFAAGMSSMGPLVFAVYPRGADTQRLESILVRNGLRTLADTSFRNQGFEVAENP